MKILYIQISLIAAVLVSGVGLRPELCVLDDIAIAACCKLVARRRDNISRYQIRFC